MGEKDLVRLGRGACASIRRALACCAAALVLASCGGGGGGAIPLTATPEATSQPPSSVAATEDPSGSTPLQAPSPPEGLHYANSTVIYAVGAPITPNIPSQSGGAVTRYGVEPALPAGLTLDPDSGVISGTPSTPSPPVLYTVTASNAFGSASTGVRIEISPRALPPSNLHYSIETPIYRLGQAVVPNTPSADGGAYTKVSVSPALPAGLALDQITGIISGTPFQLSPVTSYTVTASNSAGSSSVVLRLSVEAAPSPPTALIYRTANPMYNLGRPIVPNLPLSTGGPIKAYTVAPALPPGLNLDSVTGAISGVPRALQPAVRYVITGSNEAGSASARLDIAVVTGAMSTARSVFGLALLSDGKALAVGGNVDGGLDAPLSSAEYFDVTSGEWTLSGSMGAARAYHSLTLLPDGKVLAVGGIDSPVYVWHALATAELYDAATGQWLPTGSMNVARYGHSATLLPNGKVLVVGGFQTGAAQGSAEVSAELFDPATGQWTRTGSMNVGRADHHAVLLPTGKILVFGGADSTASELYDPASGTWSATGSTLETRSLAAATVLSNGKVLVAGGFLYSGPMTPLRSVELYDPSTGTWTAASPMSAPRWGHTSSLISGGRVLVAGGSRDGGATSLGTTEVYDATRNLWTIGAPMSESRRVHRAVTLLDGRVLLVGGGGSNGLLSSSEVYVPSP